MVYNSGDTVTLTRFRLKNPDTRAAAVEAKVWLGIPGGAPIAILNIGADGSFALPANFDADPGPVSLFTVGNSTPQGGYEFGARVLRPKTGGLLSEDIHSFSIGGAAAIPSQAGGGTKTCAAPTTLSASGTDFTPSVQVTMTRSGYGIGETVTASAFRLSNTGSSSGQVEFKLWLSPPNADPAVLLNAGADGSLSFPAMLDTDLGPLSFFTVTETAEKGDYELGARLLDPVTGAVSCFAPSSFVIAGPGRFVRPQKE
ncbi:MAG: hypothetical protein DMG07_26320 [Acidobacteria bacterium]|nr:MAG: hypothetical protein DMG07_26320 [Acidobacteriota bacterium]